MDINSVITKEEYESTTELTYEQFSDRMMRLVRLCVEESLKALPAVVNHISKEVNYLDQLSKDFYLNNKELRNEKELVAKVIEGLEALHPEKSYEEILALAAVEAKKVLQGKPLNTGAKMIDLNSYDKKLGEV